MGDPDSLLANAQAAATLLVGVAGELAGQSEYEAAGRVMAGAKVITALAAELQKARAELAKVGPQTSEAPKLEAV